MSALTPKADMCGALARVWFGPTADIAQVQQPILIGSTHSLLRSRGDARPFFHLHSGDEPVATVLGAED